MNRYQKYVDLKEYLNGGKKAFKVRFNQAKEGFLLVLLCGIVFSLLAVILAAVGGDFTESILKLLKITNLIFTLPAAIGELFYCIYPELDVISTDKDSSGGIIVAGYAPLICYIFARMLFEEPLWVVAIIAVVQLVIGHKISNNNLEEERKNVDYYINKFKPMN